MLDKQDAVHDVEAQQEEIEEEDKAEAQEDLSSWGILLTRRMLPKIMKQSGLSLRVGGDFRKIWKPQPAQGTTRPNTTCHTECLRGQSLFGLAIIHS